MAYALVALLGAVVGVSELLFRYRDDPGHSLRKVAALCYVAFNAAASAGALVLIRALHLDFGKTGSAAATTQVLVASFGSIAFFRSSFFVLRAGDQNIGAGPSVVLLSLLAAADRTVDREQASRRNSGVEPIMAPVDFTKAKESLVAVCLAASSSVPAEEAQTLRTAVAAIEGSATVGPNAKSYILGLLLIQTVGIDVLRSAVNGLGAEIVRNP